MQSEVIATDKPRQSHSDALVSKINLVLVSVLVLGDSDFRFS